MAVLLKCEVGGKREGVGDTCPSCGSPGEEEKPWEGPSQQQPGQGPRGLRRRGLVLQSLKPFLPSEQAGPVQSVSLFVVCFSFLSPT